MDNPSRRDFLRSTPALAIMLPMALAGNVEPTDSPAEGPLTERMTCEWHGEPQRDGPTFHRLRVGMKPDGGLLTDPMAEGLLWQNWLDSDNWTFRVERRFASIIVPASQPDRLETAKRLALYQLREWWKEALVVIEKEAFAVYQPGRS